MPATSTVGLTCNAVKEKAQFHQEFECCPNCHNLDSHLFTAHRLHFTPWIFVSGEKQVDLYICCQVEQALKNGSKKPKAKHSDHYINLASANLSTTNIGINVNPNVVKYHAKPMTPLDDAIAEYKDQLEKDVANTQAIFHKIEESLSSTEKKLVEDVGHELQKKQFDKSKHCTDPTCKSCMYTQKAYWSYKLQCWVYSTPDAYAMLDKNYGLTLYHPWSEMHLCAPAAEKPPMYDGWAIPEYQGFLCKHGSGPTFGAHYCANPHFVAAVDDAKSPFHIVAGLPEGDKISDWVPTQYIQYVSQIVYLDVDPPF